MILSLKPWLTELQANYFVAWHLLHEPFKQNQRSLHRLTESPSRKWPISLRGPWQGRAECTLSPPMKSSFCIYEMRTDGALHSTNNTVGSKDWLTLQGCCTEQKKLQAKRSQHSWDGHDQAVCLKWKKKSRQHLQRQKWVWKTMKDSLGMAELTGRGAISTGVAMCKTYPAKVNVLHNKTTFNKPSWELPSWSGVREGKHIQVIHSSIDSEMLQLRDRLTVLLHFYIWSFSSSKGFLKL